MNQKLAIEGGTPVRTRPWPPWPRWGEAEWRALLDALESGKWGIGGTRVPEFESRFADLHDAGYAVACCNGTIAIQIALVAAGVKPGDEVITSPYTFMATALATLAVGAVPVFVDVEPGTHNLDPGQIEDAITERTAAILPVHIGGRPADMDRIPEIAAKHGLQVVEDAAQAWLGSWRGRGVGALGAAGTFSFQSSKNLTAGEGGVLLTDDEALYHRAWSYHNCGRNLGGAWYEHEHAGLNYRLSEFQGGLLLAALERFPEEQATRRAAMSALAEGLSGIAGVLVPDADERITGHGCHIFMVRIDEPAVVADRMAIVEALQAEGIPAHPGYTTPLYQQGFFDWYAERPSGGGGSTLLKDVLERPFASYQLPVCERLCRTTIWIKHDVLLAGPEEMPQVVDAFAKVMAAARERRLGTGG